jgi:hypothetical protein
MMEQNFKKMIDDTIEQKLKEKFASMMKTNENGENFI